MEADKIVLYFSIFISTCVVIWAIWFIKVYIDIDKRKE